MRLTLIFSVLCFFCVCNSSRAESSNPAAGGERQIAEARAAILQGSHTSKSQDFFRDPPPHSTQLLKDNWENLGVRDRFANHVQPDLQRYFPDGRVDWSNQSEKLSDFHRDQVLKVTPKPTLMMAAGAYLENAATGFVKYSLEQMEAAAVERLTPDAVKEARRPMHIPRVVLDSVADDIGSLTGVPNSRMKEAWNEYTNGLQTTVENAMEAGLKVAEGDFEGAADAAKAALESKEYKGGIAALLEALMGDIDEILRAWQEDLKEAARELRSAGRGGLNLDMQLEAALASARANADRMRTEARAKAADAAAELRRSGQASASFAHAAASITSRAERESLAMQLETTAATLALMRPSGGTPTFQTAPVQSKDGSELFDIEFFDHWITKDWKIQKHLHKREADSIVYNSRAIFGGSDAERQRIRIIRGPYKLNE